MLARIATRVQVARTCRNDEGATAVEYGLMIAAIAAVIVVAVFSIGGKIGAAFDLVDSTMP